MESILGNLANLGIGGLMAAAFILVHWHTVRVVLPKVLDDFRAEQREQRDHHGRHIEALVERLRAVEHGLLDLRGLALWQRPPWSEDREGGTT